MYETMNQVIGRPSRATFEDEADDMSNGWVQIFMNIFVLTILTSALSFINYAFAEQMIKTEYRYLFVMQELMYQLYNPTLLKLYALLSPIFAVPLAIFGFSFFSFATANIFKGKADLETHIYIITAIYVPLAVLILILGLVPIAGYCFVYPVALYLWVLVAWAIKVIHDIDWLPAIVSLFIGFVGMIVSSLCSGICLIPALDERVFALL